MKTFDFNILTYLYVLRSPEFIYGIFGVMHIWLNSNLVCLGHCRMNPIDFGKYLMNSFFLQEYKKEFLYIMAYGVKFFKVF